MRNILAYVPEGFLSRIYRIYTEGADFVGKVESLEDDLCRALTLAGETFDTGLIATLPRRNATNKKFSAAATLPRKLAAQVMAAETWVVKRWDYDWLPRGILSH